MTERYDLRVPDTDRGRATRATILRAAETHFGDVGYDAASITGITQLAGVAQGTFYVYFPSKHAAFVEVIRELGASVRHDIASRAAASVGQPRAQMERAAIEGMIDFCIEHSGVYRIMREAMFVAPETCRWYYESFARAYVHNFPKRSPGVGDDVDIETIAYALIGITDWLGLRWTVWEGRRPPESVLDQLTMFLARGFEGILGDG